MNIRAKGLRLAALLLSACLPLCAALARAESADPIRVSSLSDPQSVIDEQDVSITIKIYNGSQTDMQGDITLFGPDGASVDKYAGLAAEQSVTYTGTWHVTADEIERGRVNYYIQYYVEADGQSRQMTRTIPVAIKTEAAAPQLSATYSITPAAAREGQQVTLSYTLSNTGNVELRDIAVRNPGVSQEEIAVASLSAGERVTKESVVTMGKDEMISNPTVSYRAADSDVVLVISDMARKTITLAEDGLEVSLSGEETEDLYPGQKVAMTLALKNTGETAYTDLAVSLAGGEEIAGGVELAPGASFEQEFTYTAEQDGAVSLYVEGKDATGETVAVVSNELAVTTQDPSRALILNVQAQAETGVIFSEPATLRFAVVVTNVGETDATSLTVRQAGTQVATIPSLPSGESRTLVMDLTTSIAGQFQFVVTGRDAEGNERNFESNILKVVYQQPTPEPTATPAPTPVPPTPSPVPTATPKPTLGQIVSEHVNPTVLYAIAGALAALLAIVLIVTGVSGARRKRRMAQAIDTIERSPDVRDHRGARRGSAKKRAATRRRADVDEEPIVPTPELTDDRPFTGFERQIAAQKEEEARRAKENAVTDEETLRVAPVDQRPDFVPQGKVDDSQTRVFNGLREEEAASEQTRRMPEVRPARRETPSAPEGGETMRLGREESRTLRKQSPAEDGASAAPEKKRKKGLFSRADDADDFIEDDDLADDRDDDFT